MWREYLMVFLGTCLVDVVPFPLPPAFTVMIFLQIKYNLAIWPVIFVGVAGSVLGRYILTLYIPSVAGLIFKKGKNEDIQFLGKTMKEKGWKAQTSILVYSLMPLPTTPLFLAAGISKVKPFFIIPSFFIGKFISDSLAVFLGKYATENTANLFDGVVNLKSISGLIVGLILIMGLLFIDWRSLLQEKKFKLTFSIFKSGVEV